MTKNAPDTLIPKADSMKAVIVTAALRPHIKGDTLEYNVEHIGMPPNAVIEELLKRLPGLHIDPDGTITFNGEKIQHLLVDGEDIFGSSPTLVTRVFDAAKIARVQILERRSEQAIRTGIDDGTRIKTLNLVLKDSAKDGYFGKIGAGGNTDGYYSAHAALAAFRRKEQFTALALTSNTGVTNFFNNAGGVAAGVIFVNGTDALGASSGNGVPRFDAVGLHYANTWKELRDHISGNFQYSHYYTAPLTVTQTVETQTDSTYRQQQRSQSINQQVQNWIAGMYDWAPNSTSACNLTFQGKKSTGQNQFGSTGSSTFNDTLVNSSQRTIRDEVKGQEIGGNMWWRFRVAKNADRVFSVGAGATSAENVTSGYLYSVDQFYQPNGLMQSSDTTDQRKVISNRSIRVGGSLNYIEPIGRGVVLGVTYGAYYTGDESLQDTYDRDGGKYQELVDSLSGHFKTKTVEQKATISLQGRSRMLNYTVATDYLGYNYAQHDLTVDSTSRISNNNLAPRMTLNYTPNPATGFSFNYNTSTRQPEIAQLTSVTNNNDPLHIALGNPKLKPGFSQNFRLDFHRFKTWLINIGVNMTLTNNSISTKVSTDSLGRQVSQFVNVDGGRTGGVNLAVNRKVMGFDLGIHAAGTYTRTVNYINADLTRNDAYMGGGGFSLGKFVADKYSVQLNTDVNYFDQVSSINITSPVHYWTQSHQGMVTIYVVPKLEIGTNATYTWQEKTSAFTSNTTVLLWNVYVTRNLWHGRLATRFEFNNILDANAGIGRTNSGNINTQSATNILGRYWMVSAVYHFDKKFKN